MRDGAGGARGLQRDLAQRLPDRVREVRVRDAAVAGPQRPSMVPGDGIGFPPVCRTWRAFWTVAVEIVAVAVAVIAESLACE